jgi:hypothetical protein
MRKAFLIGGEDVVKRDFEMVMALAFQDFSDPEVMVLNWTSNMLDGAEKQRTVLKGYIKDLGAKKTVFPHPDIGVRKFAESLSTVDIVYIPAGDVRHLMNNLITNHASKVLQDFDGVIIGNSAGAMSLCNTFVDKEHGPIRVRNGMGLLPITLHVHYDKMDDTFLIPLAQENRIFALSECSALKWNGQAFSSIGNVVSFGTDGKIDPSQVCNF